MSTSQLYGIFDSEAVSKLFLNRCKSWERICCRFNDFEKCLFVYIVSQVQTHMVREAAPQGCLGLVQFCTSTENTTNIVLQLMLSTAERNDSCFWTSRIHLQLQRGGVVLLGFQEKKQRRVSHMFRQCVCVMTTPRLIYQSCLSCAATISKMICSMAYESIQCVVPLITFYKPPPSNHRLHMQRWLAWL